MRKFTRTTFVAVAAAGLVIGASTMAAADTGTGSAGYFGNPECLLNALLTYGTISAGDAMLPGCVPI
ncbi:hypothetical protein [Nocardia sp. NPDC004415]